MKFKEFKSQLTKEFVRRFGNLRLSYEFKIISSIHCFFVGIDEVEDNKELLDFIDKYTLLYIDNLPDDDFVILSRNSLIKPKMPEVLNEPVKLSSDKIPNFKLKITMVAHFAILGKPNVDIDFFKNVNAPAFMYPYIRQQVRNLTLEAGYSTPLILPLFNFVQYYQGRKKKD